MTSVQHVCSIYVSVFHYFEDINICLAQVTAYNLQQSLILVITIKKYDLCINYHSCTTAHTGKVTSRPFLQMHLITIWCSVTGWVEVDRILVSVQAPKLAITQFRRVLGFGGMNKTKFWFRPKLCTDSACITKSNCMQQLTECVH